MSPPSRTKERNLPIELREVSVVEITDPTAVRGSIEVINQDVINLDPDGFKVKRVTVPLEDCCLIYQRTNAALRTRTRLHEDFDSCTILGPYARGSIDGAALTPFALITGESGAQVEIIVDSGYESVALLVPPMALKKHLDVRGNKENFVIPEGHDIWHPTAETAQKHFELGVRIAEAAESAPEIFNDNRWARYGAQVEFVDSLFATIESCGQDVAFDTDKKGISYSRIVRACEDFTLNLDGRRPYLSELCDTANVSERTLQYAFNTIMGMSPLTYLHRLRLHRARDELLRAKNDSTTVTDVALNWGFWHFGEFSRAYKNCFGEVPSKTLQGSRDD